MRRGRWRESERKEKEKGQKTKDHAWIPSMPGLQREFQAYLGYTLQNNKENSPFLRVKSNTNPKEL